MKRVSWSADQSHYFMSVGIFHLMSWLFRMKYMKTFDIKFISILFQKRKISTLIFWKLYWNYNFDKNAKFKQFFLNLQPQYVRAWNGVTFNFFQEVSKFRFKYKIFVRQIFLIIGIFYVCRPWIFASNLSAILFFWTDAVSKRDSHQFISQIWERIKVQFNSMLNWSLKRLSPSGWRF